ncbi:hypothetical protein [Streptomyces bangladeshensis]|uniref:Uncharacterized protein n=1 Tax=Streptomyces bangladeshensis TaxID=295352 RepID=A0ABN3BA31_9ACTN
MSTGDAHGAEAVSAGDARSAQAVSVGDAHGAQAVSAGDARSAQAVSAGDARSAHAVPAGYGLRLGLAARAPHPHRTPRNARGRCAAVLRAPLALLRRAPSGGRGAPGLYGSNL